MTKPSETNRDASASQAGSATATHTSLFYHRSILDWKLINGIVPNADKRILLIAANKPKEHNEVVTNSYLN